MNRYQDMVSGYVHGNISRSDFDTAVRWEDAPEPKEFVPDPETQEIFKKLIDAKREAKYKIELRFGSERTLSWVNVRVDFWISGRYPLPGDDPLNPQIAGQGDDHMFLCGYPDCTAPFPSDCVEGNWAVCPVCQSKQRNHMGLQAATPEVAGYKLDKTSNMMKPVTKATLIEYRGQKYPTVKDCLMFSCTPQHLAKVLEVYWHKLNGDAEFYSKHNPINSLAPIQHTNAAIIGVRNKDVCWRYSLRNILKDIQRGDATLQGQLERFINA